jgi:hypothetical protein
MNANTGLHASAKNSAQILGGGTSDRIEQSRTRFDFQYVGTDELVEMVSAQILRCRH